LRRQAKSSRIESEDWGRITGIRKQPGKKEERAAPPFADVINTKLGQAPARGREKGGEGKREAEVEPGRNAVKGAGGDIERRRPSGDSVL